jgi:hypothetical protein
VAALCDVFRSRYTAGRGLFSTTIGWVKCLRITSAKVRAAVSAGPPALNGTMMVTAREGNSCAGDRDEAAPRQAAQRPQSAVSSNAWELPP